jgi:hypothetical protein
MPNYLYRRCAKIPLKIKIPSKNMREKPTNTPIIYSVYQLCMVAPTCFSITLPSSRRVPIAFGEMLTRGTVDRILWMGVLCLGTTPLEQNPFSEANRFLASQEIPRTLWNPIVHCHIYKCPPPVFILSQLNPVHTPTSHFLMIK